MKAKSFFTAAPVPAFSVIVSVALLAGAHGFEHLGGLVPCPLCLDQRAVHWTAAGIAILAVVAAQMKHGPLPSQRVFLGALALVYFASAALAGYHAGVEWKWWAGPTACSGAAPVDFSTGDLLSRLSQQASAPACDEIPWSLFGLSMAGYNFLISTGLAALNVLALRGRPAWLRSASQGMPS